jgi:ribosomal protein S18 acetylase RimI-like enzyme
LTSIRSATIDDVSEVLAFGVEATVEPSATDDADSVFALLQVDPDSLLLAADDDASRTILDTVIASWDGWRGAIYRLAVSPAVRRRGIAARLVAEGERRLRAKGARRFHLIVLDDEAPAQAFWTAVGYERDDGRLRYVKTFPARETQSEEAHDG